MFRDGTVHVCNDPLHTGMKDPDIQGIVTHDRIRELPDPDLGGRSQVSESVDPYPVPAERPFQVGSLPLCIIPRCQIFSLFRVFLILRAFFSPAEWQSKEDDQILSCEIAEP